MDPITTQEFLKLKTIMSEKFGIELKDGKIALIESRLGKVLEDRGFKNLSQYIQAVVTDRTGTLEQELAERLTTHHTFFLREEAHFAYFREVVLPYLCQTVSDKDLRIWSAGCSTGEEPYTLAMVIKDFLGFSKSEWNTKILATDVSADVLEKASLGIYPAESLANVPEVWKKAYFEKLKDSRVRVTEALRSEVIFRHLNLAGMLFPFKRRFHVIFCRNVMIYFDNTMKKQLIRNFHELTEPGGYLFIGHSEGLGRDTQGYQYIMPSIYRKELRR